MKTILMIAILTLSTIGCAKVNFIGRAAVPAVHVDGGHELSDLTAEREGLVRFLRDAYRLDVTAAPASTWSCCGVPWARYLDRDLRTIRQTFDRILAISRRQAELTGTDPRLDAEAHRTAVLHKQLDHLHRALD